MIYENAYFRARTDLQKESQIIGGRIGQKGNDYGNERKESLYR